MMTITSSSPISSAEFYSINIQLKQTQSCFSQCLLFEASVPWSSSSYRIFLNKFDLSLISCITFMQAVEVCQLGFIPQCTPLTCQNIVLSIQKVGFIIHLFGCLRVLRILCILVASVFKLKKDNQTFNLGSVTIIQQYLESTI